jgi:glycosyltransferase involved in cell wall biosynthesis
MRLAFLTHEPFYPPSGGGSSEAVYLVREFIRRGHQIHLFCPRLAEPDRVARDFGITLHQFTTWRMGRTTSLRNLKYLGYPFLLQRLVEGVARTVRFELVFSQHAVAAVTAGRLKRRLGAPVVMNFLDYLTGFLETWPAYLAPRRLIRRLEAYELSLPLRYQADGVLTVSDTLADHFADAGYPRRRLQPIYFGYDADLFRREAALPEKESASGPVMVMHGSLDRHHLGPIALEAAARLARRRPGSVLRFVGPRTPALEQFLTQAGRRAPGLKVECTGFVPYDQVAQHLRDASVGIVPYEESTGVHCAFVAKVVECLGVGLPVVSTPLKAIQRYFHDEPLLRFSGFDGASFGDQILRWLEEPIARRDSLGAVASQRVRARLDWRVISARAVEFVENVHHSGIAPGDPGTIRRA